jgi:hypothetical protein
MRTYLLALLTLLLAVSCESAPTASESPTEPAELVLAKKADAAASKKKADAKRKKARNTVKKLRTDLGEKEREQHKARLEFDLGELKAAATMAGTEHSMEDAQFDLGVAERALAAYVDIEMPLKLARVALNLDRASQRVVEARQNLEGMVQIYDDEIEARSKDEILLRAERRLEFAEREFALAQQGAALESETEIPNERRKLERGVEKAARSLQKTVDAMGQARLQVEVDGLGRSDALAKIDKQLKNMKNNLRKAETKSGDKE